MKGIYTVLLLLFIYEEIKKPLLLHRLSKKLGESKGRNGYLEMKDDTGVTICK